MPRKVVTDPTKRPDYVAFGSEAHKALLGLVEGTVMGPETREAMQQALDSGGPPASLEDTGRQPVTRTTHDRFETIIDGWSRR